MSTIDRMIYLVISDHKTGPLIRETSLADTDRKTVERDIADDQYGEIISVLELNPVEGICREVTDEFQTAIDDRNEAVTDARRGV